MDIDQKNILWNKNISQNNMRVIKSMVIIRVTKLSHNSRKLHSDADIEWNFINSIYGYWKNILQNKRIQNDMRVIINYIEVEYNSNNC